LKDAVGFDAAPVRNRGSQPAFHAGKAGTQILLLGGERRLQYPLENLLMTKLQSLLDRRVRIQGGKAGMFISAAGEVPQGSDVGQPGK